MSKHFDLIWIGTGQATMSIVPRILAAGKKVAVIEGDKFGGTCVNNGCTPTKALVAASRAMFQARRGENFGFEIGELKIDFEKVMQPQKITRAKSTQGIEWSLRQHANCTVFNGFAEFVDNHTVTIGETQLSADHIVINVGSRGNTPDTPGIESIDWLSNKELLDLTSLPTHLGIVGGSYIGLEFAQIFRRFGSKVTVFERGEQLMFREDADIAEIADDILTTEGIDIVYASQVDSVASNKPQDISVNYQQANQSKSLQVSHLLFAIGRTPNSDKLNLQAASIIANQRGFIDVNEQVQTNQAHIYAVGDINGQGAFTHTSVNDGEIFWDHYSRLMGLSTEVAELDRKLSDRNLIYAMYIDPPLARVGINESDARKSDRAILMATLPMERIARAREKQETKGIIKIFVDQQTDQILGATVFGSGGDEIIGIFAAFMQTKSSYKTFRRTVFPHPTVTELLPWTLDNLVLVE